MKIVTGEVKPFEIDEAVIDRAQFDSIAAALGSFDKPENKESQSLRTVFFYILCHIYTVYFSFVFM